MTEEETKLDYPLPKTPEERKLLLESVNMVKASMIRIIDENEKIKEDLTEISEQFDLPKAALRKLATDLAKGSFASRQEKNNAYDELYLEFVNIVETSVKDSKEAAKA